jgi:hypothetical protein
MGPAAGGERGSASRYGALPQTAGRMPEILHLSEATTTPPLPE